MSYQCHFGSDGKTGIESLRRKACCSTTVDCPCESILTVANPIHMFLRAKMESRVKICSDVFGLTQFPKMTSEAYF